MKKLGLSITLVIVAVFLFVCLLIFAVPWGIIASLWKRRLKNGLNELSTWVFAWALSIDQLGNVVCKEMFNYILILHTGVSFGNPDETISSVLGKNKKANTLSKIGKGLDWVLNKLDPNHSINSIEIDE